MRPSGDQQEGDCRSDKSVVTLRVLMSKLSRSELNVRELRRKAMRLPSGDQASDRIPSPSLAVITFRGSSPASPITQISLALTVPGP